MNFKKTEKELIKEKVKELEKNLEDETLSPELEWLFVQEDIKTKTYGVCFVGEKNENLFLDQDLVLEIRDFYNLTVNRRANQTSNSVNNSADFIFAFSNETLDGLFRKLNIEGKSIVVVGSSGDQALNAIFYGGKEVTLADLNFMTKIYVELKIAALKTFTFEEFDKYFTNINEGFFKYPAYYAKLSQHLDSKTKLFWDTVLLDGDREILSNAIAYMDQFRAGCFYNNEKDYYKMQRKLKENNYKLNYVFAPLDEFAKRIDQKVDVILLSNIHAYYRDNQKVFFKIVKDLYENKLNVEGVIQLTSAYDEEYGKISNKKLDKFYKNNEIFILNEGKIGLDSLFVRKKQELKEESNEMEK